MGQTRAVVAVGVNMLIVCKVGSEAVGHMLQMAGGGQIPRNGLTWGLCLQQWGSHYYKLKKKILIDGLYFVI